MAALYLTAKLSAYPKSPRSVINVYHFLCKTLQEKGGFSPDDEIDEDRYHVTEGYYEMLRSRLWALETEILRVLGFQTHVALPHTLCINYLQALDVFDHPQGNELARRVVAHLNTALLSPQLLYLTHQPAALATAAIYLAAREIGVKLPDGEWWEVFDTDREELGFLVVALRSIEGFAEEEKGKWAGRVIPLTTEELDHELDDRQTNGHG